MSERPAECRGSSACLPSIRPAGAHPIWPLQALDGARAIVNGPPAPKRGEAIEIRTLIAQRVDLCRQRHQDAAPWAAESAERLALESYVAVQSRGMPLAPPDDPRLAPYRERGRALFHQRIGQLDLACAQCHESNAGQRLGGSVIPEAHPTGYPIYRIEWQSLGSLERRLRGCMTGVRAAAPAWGAIELVELEVFLASRAAGMMSDAPAVRP